MKRKSKYVVAAGAGAEQEASKAAADVRITSHGKIHSYAEYINGSLAKQPDRALFIYAQGAAVCKLVTVLEIVKRTEHAGLTQLLTIGDTVHSPCLRRTKVPSNGSAESSAGGLYSSHLSRAFSQGLSSAKPIEEAAAPEVEPQVETSKQPGESWMQVELRIV